jgi:hypothetical protein
LADKKISELVSLTGANAATGDLLPIVDISATETKKITREEFFTSIPSIDINGGTIDGTVIGGSTPAAISGTTGQFGTSLNVDGTVTANGVAIDGDSITANAQNALTFEFATATGIISADRTGGNFGELSLRTTAGSTPLQRLNISYDGDISFYEDTGTTPKFFWDASAESLGIGTSSPLSPLVVAEGTGQHGFEVQPGTLTYIFAYDRATADYGDLDIAGQTLRFGTDNGLERMRIDASGNVGIGLTPNATGGGYKALQLGLMTNWAFPTTGSAYRSHNLYYDGSNRKYVTTGTAHEYEQSSTGHVFSTAASGTAGTNVTLSEAMRIDASGNVGIGTSSIASGGAGTTNLNVHTPSATSVYLKLSNTGTGNTASDGFDLAADSSGNAYIINRENAPLLFSTNNTERARIDASGNLLVGTTSATGGGRLELKGSGASAYGSTIYQGNNANSVRLQSGGVPTTSDTVGISIGIGGSAEGYFGLVQESSSYGSFVFQTFNGSYSERMRLDSSGKLLVNTTTAYGSSAPLVSYGGIAIVDSVAGRGITQEIVTGANGSFTTITVSFDSDSVSGSLIVEILMTGFSGVYLDYVAGVYSNQADVVMRSNASGGTSVALTGDSGSSWTATITTSVTHPVVKVKATAGGLTSTFANAPTVTFA